MSGIEITQADRHLALWLIGVLDVAVPVVTFEQILAQISKSRHEARAEALEENRAWSEVVTTIMARCAALEDEASDGLGRSVNEHAQGYWRGQKTTAKSLRRELHDLTRAIRSDEREG